MENEALIKEQLNKLPTDLKQAIEAVPWKKMVGEMAVSNKLSLEQSAFLEQETMLIVYGFEPLANYVDNLVRELKIEEGVAFIIAEAANEKIFKEIENKMEGTIHTNLPMIEDGEVAHDVPHVEPAPAPKLSAAPSAPETPPSNIKTRPHSDTPVEKVSLDAPDYRYPGGTDPYREPLA